jgi:chaperone required for assembly of F1-ATPase
MLADAVALEWAAQGEEILPAAMTLTRLATTVVDLMPARRADAVEEIADFAGTDLLCYRASAPHELVLRQERLWQPWLDWAAREIPASLVTTRTVEPIAQPEASLRSLRAVIESLDDWRLVGVHASTTALGSLVLALALERGAASVDTVLEAALLDENFAIETWGEEREQQRRLRRLRSEVGAAAQFLAALRR